MNSIKINITTVEKWNLSIMHINRNIAKRTSPNLSWVENVFAACLSNLYQRKGYFLRQSSSRCLQIANLFFMTNFLCLFCPGKFPCFFACTMPWLYYISGFCYKIHYKCRDGWNDGGGGGGDRMGKRTIECRTEWHKFVLISWQFSRFLPRLSQWQADEWYFCFFSFFVCPKDSSSDGREIVTALRVKFPLNLWSLAAHFNSSCGRCKVFDFILYGQLGISHYC